MGGFSMIGPFLRRAPKRAILRFLTSISYGVRLPSDPVTVPIQGVGNQHFVTRFLRKGGCVRKWLLRVSATCPPCYADPVS